MGPDRVTRTPDIRPVDDAGIGPNDITYYYSREHRLKKAGPRVRALYEDAQKPKRRFALFRSLVDTKPKAMLLTAIVIISIVILLFSILLP
ncbi:MAG: hypothetical protein LBK66_10905 [Spirochaetaceae bacterium]|jgi:multisubunit Na+/H+ antiporter MnhC subunit|nr:hypothetical protein [Spirochaetaceae bacterium]